MPRQCVRLKHHDGYVITSHIPMTCHGRGPEEPGPYMNIHHRGHRPTAPEHGAANQMTVSSEAGQVAVGPSRKPETQGNVQKETGC